MIAVPLGASRVEEALRAVQALGAHRYVAGRLHMVHAFAFSALAEDAAVVLVAGREWARALLADPRIDAASRDEVLWRRSSDAELVALLDAYWRPSDGARLARDRLQRRLESHGLAVGEGAPFDESLEDSLHPLLIDAGWELKPLSQLDPERHKGAIGAFGERLAFDSAAFEDDTSVPPAVALFELPAIGAAELLLGTSDEGVLAAPLVVWTEGNATYLDYVVRGVRRAAGLT